jgi:hypothetical protein
VLQLASTDLAAGISTWFLSYSSFELLICIPKTSSDGTYYFRFLSSEYFKVQASLSMDYSNKDAGCEPMDGPCEEQRVNEVGETDVQAELYARS